MKEEMREAFEAWIATTNGNYNYFDVYKAATQHQQIKIKELESQLEQAKKDQARYQWLVGSGKFTATGFKECPWGLRTGNGRKDTKDELDQAIDAAMQEGK